MSVYLDGAQDKSILELSAQDTSVKVGYDNATDSIVLSAEYKSIYQKAYQQLISNYTYLSSINTKTADQDGTILLLGSQCISIVDSTDSTDPLSTPSDAHTINIFDGCKACNDCDAVWDIIQALQQLHIWIIGLKDCILHYQSTASTLWEKLTEHRNTNLSDDTGLCSYTSQMPTRQQAFGRATKLLYQYKAAVAMWNYLVYNLSSRVTVQPALQDYTGFSVKIKRRFNMCGCSGADVGGGMASLTIELKRVSGQRTKGSVQRQQVVDQQATTQQTGQQQTGYLIKKVPYALGFYVDAVPQNTYIQTHTDKGGFSQYNKAVQHYVSPEVQSTDPLNNAADPTQSAAGFILPGPQVGYIAPYPDEGTGGGTGDGGTGIPGSTGNISYTLASISYDPVKIKAVFQYNITGTGQYICSAQLKILPVMLSGVIDIVNEGSVNQPSYIASVSQVQSPMQSLSLAEYIDYRKRNSQLSDSKLVMTNRWQIHTLWTGGCAKDSSDATYYKTSYNLQPNIAILQSQASQLVKQAIANNNNT